jgi:hypothetical protein
VFIIIVAAINVTIIIVINIGEGQRFLSSVKNGAEGNVAASIAQGAR